MPAPAAPFVFLDRDGVINRDSDEYIKSVDEWLPLPGSLEAISLLTDAGFRCIVISNQSGIGRGLFSEATLAAIHAAMRDAIEAAGYEGWLGAEYVPSTERTEDSLGWFKPYRA